MQNQKKWGNKKGREVEKKKMTTTKKNRKDKKPKDE